MDTGDGQTIANDRFFAEVRRRHPDIDIVLLPQVDPGPAQPAAPAAPLEPIEPAALAEALETTLTGLLPLMAPGIDLPAPQWRWGPGDSTGSVARETLVAAENLEAVPALTALSGAERALVAEGWHVLVPPDGLPRVLANSPDGTQAQVVYVEGRSRYAVRLRSASYVVGRESAADLLRAEP